MPLEILTAKLLKHPETTEAYRGIEFDAIG
jgi:hypothetical protein